MPESAVTAPLVAGPDYTRLFAGLAAEFLSGKTRDLAWRRAQLKAVQRMMQDSEAALFAALKSDLGKSAQEAFVTETRYVSADAAYSARKLNRWTRRRRV
ncbi:MAG: aldehyde dehydrogenase family protein, partial [Gammaproteobacteria bacterium]|nr:aldehyde dehydrogenase family protein [Gammaproteobacteria bacterium]